MASSFTFAFSVYIRLM